MFQDSSGSQATMPTVSAIHTRASRSVRRPSGNSSSAMKPTAITPMNR